MTNAQKARELLNANITHVSYVDKGANQKKFFLTKSEEVPTFEKQVKILTKSDDAQKLVYGVVYEPDVEDAHGDFMKAEEIEKAAHQFLKDARNIDTQHDFESGAGEVVESYVAPADIEIGSETITKGSWVLVTKATDEIWDSIQKGDITGYSMAGVAETVEVEKEDEEKNLFKMLKEFFTKGEVKDKFYEGKKKREFMDAYWIFEDIFFDEIWSGTPDVARIKETALDFAELLQDIANSPDVMKALGEIKKEEVIKMKMSKEDLQAILKAELEPLTAKIDALEKAQEEVQGEETPEAGADVQKAEGAGETPSEKEDLMKSFKEALGEAIQPLSDRLEAVEKSRGISKQLKDEQEQEEEQGEESVFKSLFRL